MVSILSISGFVARERAVFLVLDARPDVGQVKVEISSLEDLVLSGSSWRNFLSWPGNDWGTVWTPPELLPQVALINHTNISLTHCACLGKTLFHQLLKVCVLLDMIEQVLGVILLSFATLELWASYLGPALVPLDFGHSVSGLGLSSHWTEAPSPEACLRQFLVFKSVAFRMLAPGQWLWVFEYISQTSCQDGLIASQRQVGSMGVAEPVSGLRVALPPLYIFNHMKKACVYFMK